MREGPASGTALAATAVVVAVVVAVVGVSPATATAFFLGFLVAVEDRSLPFADGVSPAAAASTSFGFDEPMPFAAPLTSPVVPGGGTCFGRGGRGKVVGMV